MRSQRTLEFPANAIVVAACNCCPAPGPRTGLRLRAGPARPLPAPAERPARRPHRSRLPGGACGGGGARRRRSRTPGPLRRRARPRGGRTGASARAPARDQRPLQRRHGRPPSRAARCRSTVSCSAAPRRPEPHRPGANAGTTVCCASHARSPTSTGATLPRPATSTKRLPIGWTAGRRSPRDRRLHPVCGGAS